ncbi:hypothetical protein DYQ93_11530 [Xanthomonas sp. LMG 8992]|uniref:hypothetical protein n=1 Tax=Xanthomonas sp. LMG 8992 TaxID=1591157 RepID=UPI00136A2E7C|nr:hypothetical protein [Xanthomonas sp. LMG 8992]MXV11651.1 hypothetical protein [Xanthomonas sp. LMG 8992]
MLDRWLDKAADRYDARNAAPQARAPGGLGSAVVGLAWVLALIGAIVGAVLLVSAATAATPAAQASSAALGIGCAVVPYVLARACQYLHR